MFCILGTNRLISCAVLSASLFKLEVTFVHARGLVNNNSRRRSQGQYQLKQS